MIDKVITLKLSTDNVLFKVTIAIIFSYLTKFIIRLFTKDLRKIVLEHEPDESAIRYEKFLKSSARLGFFERLLYVIAFIIGRPEFIGLWLGLKAVGGWKDWIGEEKRQEDPDIARLRFNTFMVSNAISILSSSLIFYIINH